jgi:pyruvate/2-oxoglutarate dehydrogenase complex dihydrolipoamide dehydrogenase (E3) component
VSNARNHTDFRVRTHSVRRTSFARAALSRSSRRGDARLVDALGLRFGDYGYIEVDDAKRTNGDGLWATGDVQRMTEQSGPQIAGSMTTFMIVHGWFNDDSTERRAA